MTPHPRCQAQGCFIAEAVASLDEERLRRGADPLTPPADFGSQIGARGGLPRGLRERIEAIEAGRPYIEPEPRSRLFLWIVLAFLALVLGVAAVAVWASHVR